MPRKKLYTRSMAVRLVPHEVFEATCERCGHVWIAQIARIDNKLVNLDPITCARCKTRYWNRPRIRARKAKKKGQGD